MKTESVAAIFCIIQYVFVTVADGNERKDVKTGILEAISSTNERKSSKEYLDSFLKKHDLTPEKIQEGKEHWKKVADINKDGEVSECEALKVFHKYYMKISAAERVILRKIAAKNEKNTKDNEETGTQDEDE